MPQKGPPSSFLIICSRMYVDKSQRVPPFAFLGTMRHFLKKNLIFCKKNMSFCSQLGKKWFPSLIEHERHPLGVSKLFSELFTNSFWACLKNFEFLSLRFSADFRRSRLVLVCSLVFVKLPWLELL